MQTSLRRYRKVANPSHCTLVHKTTHTNRATHFKMEPIEPGKIIDGAILWTNSKGGWAKVPGFNGELYVTTKGFVKQWDVRNGKWFKSSMNNPKPHTGDVMVGHRGRDYRVHQLMGLAFFGPPPTPSHTIDHITKYDGDLIRERSDNRIENLRWASKREQALNRNKQEPRRDGRPVWVWKVGDDESSAVWYSSSLEAAKKLDLNAGGVSRVANGEKQWQTKGFRVKFAENREPDKIHDDEEFREINGHFVSQYGRALDGQTKAYSYTPKVTKGLMYACVSKSTVDGIHTKTDVVHRLVAIAFPEIVGEMPRDGQQYTVDHIDRDKTNNAASNLRWLSISDQNHNRDMFKGIQKSATPVELKAPGEEHWQRFDSQCEAVLNINLKYGTKLTQTTVSDSLKMNRLGRTINKGKHKGWSIRAAVLKK